MTLAYASHTLLDWLGDGFVAADRDHGAVAGQPRLLRVHLHVFMAISRRYWLPGFWASNARALARELAILLPLAALVFFARRRPT